MAELGACACECNRRFIDVRGLRVPDCPLSGFIVVDDAFDAQFCAESFLLWVECHEVLTINPILRVSSLRDCISESAGSLGPDSNESDMHAGPLDGIGLPVIGRGNRTRRLCAVDDANVVTGEITGILDSTAKHFGTDFSADDGDPIVKVPEMLRLRYQRILHPGIDLGVST